MINCMNIKKRNKIILLCFTACFLLFGITKMQDDYSDLFKFTNAVLECNNIDSVFSTNKQYLASEFINYQMNGQSAKSYFGDSLRNFQLCKKILYTEGRLFPKKYTINLDETTNSYHLRIKYIACKTYEIIIFDFILSGNKPQLLFITFELS